MRTTLKRRINNNVAISVTKMHIRRLNKYVRQIKQYVHQKSIIMKNVLIVLLLAISTVVSAATYYIDPAGSDSN